MAVRAKRIDLAVKERALRMISRDELLTGIY